MGEEFVQRNFEDLPTPQKSRLKKSKRKIYSVEKPASEIKLLLEGALQSG